MPANRFSYKLIRRSYQGSSIYYKKIGKKRRNQLAEPGEILTNAGSANTCPYLWDKVILASFFHHHVTCQREQKVFGVSQSTIIFATENIKHFPSHFLLSLSFFHLPDNRSRNIEAGSGFSSLCGSGSLLRALSPRIAPNDSGQCNCLRLLSEGYERHDAVQFCLSL